MFKTTQDNLILKQKTKQLNTECVKWCLQLTNENRRDLIQIKKNKMSFFFIKIWFTRSWIRIPDICYHRLASPFTDKCTPALLSNIVNSEEKYIKQINSTPPIFFCIVLDFANFCNNLIKLDCPKKLFINCLLTI